jgi:hypothetical protein
MDAIVIDKNNVHQFSAELRPGALVSFSLEWIGNAKGRIGIRLTRVDNLGTHAWEPRPLLVGDTISFVATEVHETNEPAWSLATYDREQVRKGKLTVKQTKGATRPHRNIGTLLFEINSKETGSFPLNTDNLLLATFVWLGDSSGQCLTHIGVDGSVPEVRIPNISFGDKVTLSSLPATAPTRSRSI